MKKRIIALALALALVLALGPTAPASAAKTDLSGLPGHEILALLPNTLRRPPRPTKVEQVGFQIGLTDSRDQWTLSQSIDDVFQEVVDLTDSLTAGKTTDTQKVKAIFDWVSENVKYDKRRSRGESGGPLYTYATKRGVCWDYASLSEVMCTIAEIPAAFIDGMSSSSDQPSGGHAWNAAFADGRWVFFDATWRLWDMAPNYHDHTGDFDCYDGVFELAGHAKVDGSAGELVLRRRRGFECPAVVTVPSYGVTTLDGFHGCTNLTELIFADTVTTIATAAFSGCTGLTELTFPDSVTTIEAQAFLNCTGLKSVTIPDSVTTLEDGVFMGCTGLTEMTIPGSVPTIESALFYECTGLERVTIPNGVAAIGGHAFMGCTSLKNVTIPGSAAAIGTQAFYGCTALESATISEGVKTIEKLAFFGCTNLKKADLPDSITSVDGTAFTECPNLPRRTTIPAGVTEIESFAFQDNTALTEMVIPDHVTKIGYRAFFGCTNLARVTIPASVKSIDVYAFNGCSSLTDVTVPAGITRIESQTFGWCTGLKSVTLPDSVTSIGDNAFSACTSLQSIAIPAGVTAIGEKAFIKCTSLTDVVIPSGVTAIEEGTFMNCAALKSVTIPAGVTRIGVWAFENCGSLKDVYYAGSEAQWKAIQIDTSYDSNGPLLNAAVHYNSPAPKLPAAQTAQPATQTVNVDGKDVEFAMYALGGGSTNYIRVRDLAVILNGTAAQFDVGWNGNVTLTGRTAYTGTADKAPFNTAMAYDDYTQPTAVNGKDVKLEAIQITYQGGGYTYYKLRDLGQALGFNVGWAAGKGIYVETNKPYDPGN